MQDGLCLRYPENFGLIPAINYDTAVNMLLRAIPLSQQFPYTWGFIDKPPEGQAILIFLQPGSAFPIDGLRFQEHETRFIIPVGSTRELEVTEAKFGFIPNSQDAVAWRMRRRFRLHKGGHPQLILVHYTRGPQSQINPGLMNVPVRSYPLRPINEPAVFVMGDKAGQKVYNHGVPQRGPISQVSSPPHHGLPTNVHTGSMNLHTQKAMLAQQNMNMEALERRRERERARERSVTSSQRPPPPRIEDEESADEADTISTRTLAMTRYRRNHEFMNDVFRQAAFGDKKGPVRSPPYSIFDKTILEDKSAKLKIEIEVLQKRAAERAMARLIAERESAENQANLEVPDVPMEVGSEGISA